MHAHTHHTHTSRITHHTPHTAHTAPHIKRITYGPSTYMELNFSSTHPPPTKPPTQPPNHLAVGQPPTWRIKACGALVHPPTQPINYLAVGQPTTWRIKVCGALLHPPNHPTNQPPGNWPTTHLAHQSMRGSSSPSCPSGSKTGRSCVRGPEGGGAAVGTDEPGKGGMRARARRGGSSNWYR